MKKKQVVPINAFQDNYIWLIQRQGVDECAIVDPGDAAPVIQHLQANNLQLKTILITHHHPDHIGGLRVLKEKYPNCMVYGPMNERIELIDVRLREGDWVRLECLGMELLVMEVPGHTVDHIAYYYKDEQAPFLFCGDTIFSVGCGRLFDGTAEQLYSSLQKIKQLPGATRIYCAHEYTLSNIKFAQHVEPLNSALREWHSRAQMLRANHLPTLPTCLSDELEVNPFLRVDQVPIREAVEKRHGGHLPAAAEVFRVLRQWKDEF